MIAWFTGGEVMQGELEKQIYNDIRNDLAKGALVLPTLPDVALRLYQLIEDGNASTGQLAKVLTTDPAVCARVIQIANSAMNGYGKPVSTLEQAIVRLGSRALRNTVTGVVIQQMFHASRPVVEQKMRSVWQHSTSVAAICYSLAPYLRMAPDQAMLAGLLHDIGALPILKKADAYTSAALTDHALERLVEKLHVLTGTEVLKAWRFPEELIRVAAEHESHQRRPSSGRADLVDLVIIANLQAYLREDRTIATIDWQGIPSFSRLGVSPESFVMELENESKAIDNLSMALCA